MRADGVDGVKQTSVQLGLACEAVRRTLIPLAKAVDVIEGDATRRLTVTRHGYGPILHKKGSSWQVHFEVSDAWSTYHALVAAPRLDDDGLPVFKNPNRLLLRIDSGCLTGQVFLDETCDCRQQLHEAISLIESEEGVVIAVPRQDGRGMGIDFKLGTLTLQQEAGADTVDAARALAHSEEVDARTYGGAIAVLKFLGIQPGTHLRVMTNNDLKMQALVDNGYFIGEHVPLRIPPNEHTARHLDAKRLKLGHHL